MDIIYLIDILGTFAFAISGALVALDKKFDIFGVVIIAFITVFLHCSVCKKDYLMNYTH